MMTRKLIFTLAAISLVASQAFAEDIVVNQGEQATRIVTEDGRTIILNSSQSNAKVSNQPATVVQAAPVAADSRTEALRKARESAELGTEQRLAEKLEESRLQDEKNRADRLFGREAAAPAATTTEVKAVEVQAVQVQQVQPQVQQQVQPQAQPVVAQPVQQVAPAAIVVQPAPAVQAVAADAAKVAVVEEIRKDSYYFIGGIGTAQYYGAVNVVSNAAAGFGVGWDKGEGLAYEADFMYSNYMINEYWKPPYVAFKEMAQYDFSGAIKYSFMKGNFKPMVGGFVTYSYRSYTNRGPCMCTGMPTDTSLTSGAVNVGLIAGAEYKLTREFAVGLEYRYSMNLWARSDDRFIKPEYLMNGTTPIENMSYYSFMLNGKYTF